MDPNPDEAYHEEMGVDAMSDQTAKRDEGKLRLTLVPTEIIRAIAAVRMYGTKKYGDPDNWKRVEKERYRDAMFRHLLAYLDDPTSTDAESGLPHLWHICCNAAFLCEMENARTYEIQKGYGIRYSDTAKEAAIQKLEYGDMVDYIVNGERGERDGGQNDEYESMRRS